jgi:hypothetical protein
MTTRERNRAGFLINDCRLLADLREDILYRISASCGHVDEVAMERRIRTLASWLVSTAEGAFGSDPEAAGLRIADDFWERRRNGERCDDDANA